jgi:hypothetical protein
MQITAMSITSTRCGLFCGELHQAAVSLQRVSVGFWPGRVVVLLAVFLLSTYSFYSSRLYFHGFVLLLLHASFLLFELGYLQVLNYI